MDDGAMDAATSTWRVSGAAMVDGRRDLVEGCRDGCAQIGSESRTNLGGSTILENGKLKMPNCWRSPFFPLPNGFETWHSLKNGKGKMANCWRCS
jgi:hypothetical protein